MDDPGLVTATIEQVQAATSAYVEANAQRLTRCPRLLGRFTEAYVAWKEGRSENAKQITETVNELLIAKCLLQDPLCQHVEYETPLPGSRKTIDFLFQTTTGNRIFYDVKTVHPDDRDAWDRFERAQRKGWLTPGTELVLEKEWMGAELAHHQFASYEKFLEHTLEAEEKIRHVADRCDGHTYFRMVFCGDGFRWHQDQLEDFADTYFTGRSQWNHFATMQEHYLKAKGLTFDRSILGFCYFERAPRYPEPSRFECDVRGPRTNP